MPPEVKVVIASDGKRGHENQSRVLARMLGDTEPLIMRLRNPEGGWGETLLRAAFAVRGKWRMPRRSAGERVRELMRPESPAAFRDFSAEIGRNRDAYRIFSVSTGAPPATGNLLLSCLLDAEALCVMTPSMLPKRLFKLMIVPEHDIGERGGLGTLGLPPNVLANPLAVSYHNQQSAQHAAKLLIEEAQLYIKQRYWAVAVGGPSKSVEWQQALFEARFTMLIAQARKAGVQLLVTTSRRTPSEASNFIQRESQDITAYFLDATKDSRNPLPAYFELCEAVAITGDSFSMVSEAIQAGFKPYLIPPGEIPHKLMLGLLILQHDHQAVEVWNSKEAPGPVEIGRNLPNRFYNELRTEVRARLNLD